LESAKLCNQWNQHLASPPPRPAQSSQPSGSETACLSGDYFHRRLTSSVRTPLQRDNRDLQTAWIWERAQHSAMAGMACSSDNNFRQQDSRAHCELGESASSNTPPQLSQVSPPRAPGKSGENGNSNQRHPNLTASIRGETDMAFVRRVHRRHSVPRPKPHPKHPALGGAATPAVPAAPPRPRGRAAGSRTAAIPQSHARPRVDDGASDPEPATPTPPLRMDDDASDLIPGPASCGASPGSSAGPPLGHPGEEGGPLLPWAGGGLGVFPFAPGGFCSGSDQFRPPASCDSPPRRDPHHPPPADAAEARFGSAADYAAAVDLSVWAELGFEGGLDRLDLE
jgi:hypothetical protein